LNDIQRRLAEIDRQFDQGPAYYYEQTVTTAPLVFCAVGLIAGIIIQGHSHFAVLNYKLAAFCTAIAALLLIIYLLWFTSASLKSYTIPLLTTALFIYLGMIRMASFDNALPNDIRNAVGNEPNMAAIRGIIATEPYIEDSNWKFAKFKPGDQSSSFYMELTEAESINGWVAASGIVRMRVNEPILDLRAGDRIQIYCELSRFKGAANPGEFDMA